MKRVLWTLAGTAVMLLCTIGILIYSNSHIHSVMGGSLTQAEKTPQPTPEVTQPPLRIAVLSQSEQFTDGALSGAWDGVEIFEATSIQEVNGADAALLYMPDIALLDTVTVPNVLYSDAFVVALDRNLISVSQDQVVTAAWQALYEYPTHDAPVRLLTLTEASSVGEGVYADWLQAGKLMDKGLYTDGIKGAQSWTEETLDGIVPGLLDTIYAENPEYAKAAYAALKKANRNDSVEVICAGLTPQIMECMIEDHWLMGAAVGYNEHAGGALAADMAQELFEKGSVTKRDFAPQVVHSQDVLALYQSGVTDPYEIINRLHQQQD